MAKVSATSSRPRSVWNKHCTADELAALRALGAAKDITESEPDPADDDLLCATYQHEVTVILQELGELLAMLGTCAMTLPQHNEWKCSQQAMTELKQRIEQPGLTLADATTLLSDSFAAVEAAKRLLLNLQLVHWDTFAVELQP